MLLTPKKVTKQLALLFSYIFYYLCGMYTKDMPYTLLYIYYYTDRLSIWLSVDPLSDKYPHLSPYAYCADNPVKYIDPTGEFPIETIWDIVNVLYDVGAAVVNYIKGDHQASKAIEKSVSTSRAARREVMRKEGIPTSQQTRSQSKNSSGREYSYDVPQKGGGIQKNQFNNKQKIEVIKNNLIGRQVKLKLIIVEIYS